MIRYRNDWTGIIDLKSMLADITGLAQRGPDRSTVETSFYDLCVTLGFERALDKMILLANSERSYPHNIVPVFDLDMITPETQTKALAIHLATGNFTKHIVGFRDTESGDSVRVPKRQRRADRDWSLATR